MADFFGVYQAIVTNVNDPEKRGRIKCRIPEVLGEAESAWCEPCVPVAYDGGGDFCLPPVDEGVWVSFISGDVNRPVYFGGWWQEADTPLAGNYTDLDDIRIISYNGSSIVMKNGVIYMNVGNGTFDLRIQDGNITINGNTTIDGNTSIDGNTTIDGDTTLNGNMTQEGNLTRTGNVTQTGTVTQNGEVTQNGNITINGNLTVNGELLVKKLENS